MGSFAWVEGIDAASKTQGDGYWRSTEKNMRTVTIKQYKTKDGRVFTRKRSASAHETKLRKQEAETKEPDVRRTKSGKWSIPCRNCGRRHLMKYSDDYVWCPTCRAECGGSGHEPDQDDATVCYLCGERL